MAEGRRIERPSLDADGFQDRLSPWTVPSLNGGSG